MKIENLNLSTGKYCLMIEGVMPYNTNEGQLSIEVISNRENFQLEEIQHVEPVEYTDKYYQSKYGIIFKEKIVVGLDHTSTAFNIRLKRNGEYLDRMEDMKRLFRIEVLD